ncbi:YbaB/EbfC family nucleoid-associated protein [Streptosporangium sp. NPDC051022]|uniref:YbaB/EbfC family nucleoid-associated protein n=1 Tax=Streptosporangium sp. NPDC051022 TaxID=3155752 RepID=UPI00342817C7
MADFRFDPADFDPEDLERMAGEADRTLRRLAGVQGELGGIRGTGTGADGMIGAVTDGSGRLERIDLNPRVMRLESRALAEELLKAVRAAQDDGERQVRELLGEAMGGMGLPAEPLDLDEIEARLRRSHDSYAHVMRERSTGLP